MVKKNLQKQVVVYSGLLEADGRLAYMNYFHIQLTEVWYHLPRGFGEVVEMINNNFFSG